MSLSQEEFILIAQSRDSSIWRLRAELLPPGTAKGDLGWSGFRTEGDLGEQQSGMEEDPGWRRSGMEEYHG